MKKIILALFIFYITIIAVGQECPPPQTAAPGGDNPDDNYSYANSNSSQLNVFSIIPEIMIFQNGYYEQAQSLFNNKKTKIKLISGKEELDINIPLILPTGSLYGMQNEATLKAVIQEYVNLGGTIVVFDQQYSTDYNVIPVPDGESLHAYGWREDQSCFWGAAYFDQLHPVLSSMHNWTMASGGVDGYFETVPASSTIYLRKSKNDYPVLLSYPVGDKGGQVILTSFFSDYSYVHGRVSASELYLMRDLLTFAKNPNLPIPSYYYNLYQDPKPNVNLTVKVMNNNDPSDTTSNTATAVKAHIKVYTPNRDIVMYEFDAPVSLAPGQNSDVLVNFIAPATLYYDYNYGICHTDYELIDADGNTVQKAAEADSGRFALYKMDDQTHPPVPDVKMWITMQDEYAELGKTLSFTLHTKNNSAQAKSIDFVYHLGHWGAPYPGSVAVAAGQEIAQNYTIPYSDYQVGIWVTSPDYQISYTSKGVNEVFPFFSMTAGHGAAETLHISGNLNYNFHALNQVFTYNLSNNGVGGANNLSPYDGRIETTLERYNGSNWQNVAMLDNRPMYYSQKINA